MPVYEVNMNVFVSAKDRDEAIKKAGAGDIACYNINSVSIPACVSSEIEVTFDGQRKVVYQKQDETWIIKECSDFYVSSAQGDDADQCRAGCHSFAADEDDWIAMGMSEHHYLDSQFLAELMFDDFCAKCWSDGKDEEDEQKAKGAVL